MSKCTERPIEVIRIVLSEKRPRFNPRKSCMDVKKSGADHQARTASLHNPEHKKAPALLCRGYILPMRWDQDLAARLKAISEPVRLRTRFWNWCT